MGYQKKQGSFFLCLVFALYGWCQVGFSQTVGLFFDATHPQISFAASEIQKALTTKGLSSELQPLSRLNTPYNNSKIVLSSHNNTEIKSVFTAQAGQAYTAPTSQGYALRTTTAPTSYWIFGGDTRGIMYGGLQIAENIQISGISQTYNTQESPYLLYRGIKFNIPMDYRSPTYEEGQNGYAHRLAIKDVWDITFWKEYLDEMARHRYNVLSLWTNHPFTTMVKVKGYEDVVIEDVQGWDDPTGQPKLLKKMTIEEKIKHWTEVMQYAKNRGFDIYWFTWNVMPFGNNLSKYNIVSGSTNASTSEYYGKSTAAFLRQYPMIDGLGVTVGENMENFDSKAKEDWAWKAYGKPMYDYADSLRNSSDKRELVFIHRQHQGSVSAILDVFKTLDDLPNVRLDMSFKYSKARIHGGNTPNFMNNFLPDFSKYSRKTWLEGRNDDFYFLHWADPDFVRGYYKNLPEKDKYIQGPLHGSDGWVWTRDFTSKSLIHKNNLTVKNRWLMFMLWGRLGYNPDLSNDVIINNLAIKYPNSNAGALLDTWSKASSAVQLSIEQVAGDQWDLDFQWWPEGWNHYQGWKTLAMTKTTTPFGGSKFCSLDGTVKKNCGSLIPATTTIKKMENLALDAARALQSIPRGNAELDLNLKNIYAQTRLALYSAKKYTAAMLDLENKTAAARDSMAIGYCYWKQYTDQMFELYTGVNNHRGSDMKPDWHAWDAKALSDYTGLGGQGEPKCSELVYTFSPALQTLSYSGPVELWVYHMNGKHLKTLRLNSNPHDVQIRKELTQLSLPFGMYYTITKVNGQQMNSKPIILFK